MKNTIKNGQVRVLIFKEKNVWYGVALELNIVESGDDPREVMFTLDEAVRGYVKAASKAKLGPSVLNQKSDAEYEKIWNQVKSKKPIKSPLKVYSTSSLMLSSM